MEDQCSPLCWPYYYQDEGIIEELKHSLLYTKLELETTILSAQEELARKDDELVHLNSLVAKISKERDEAVAKCQTLMLEKLLVQKQLQQQQQQSQIDATPSSGTTSIEDEPRKGEFNNVVHSSSDSDENFITSPGNDLMVDVMDRIVLKKPFPEKGKFLQAVMEAGPLLQPLLLAGPLPQWQHPPPQLNTVDIPPVTISSPTPAGRLLHQDSSLSSCTNGYNSFGKKRVLDNSDQLGSDSSPNPKVSKSCSPIIIDQHVVHASHN